MNFLAHAHLSYSDPQLLTGNMIADSSKQKKPEEYPHQIKKGILLHRAIDEYTDTHQIVKRTRKFFSPVIRHYALVISDVIYDHFLGVNWKNFNAISLKEFSDQTYAQLDANKAHFPERFERIFPYMKDHDWFGQYATKVGIHQTIDRLKYRSRSFIWGKETIKVFEDNYEALQEDFLEFYPQLEDFSKTFIQDY